MAASRLLESLLFEIERTEHGEKLLKELREKDSHFLHKIRFSHVSHTETVFSRAYFLDGHQEVFKVEKFIQLKSSMPFLELLYDFVHELVHFTYQVPQNPYNFSRSMEDFIHNGISGKGGELEAFKMECLISWELETKEEIPTHRLCARYRKGKNTFLAALAEKDFYASGSYYEELSLFKEKLPFLSPVSIRFRSSLNTIPYPIFFMREHISLRRQACTNNRKKEHLLTSHSSNRRVSSAKFKESIVWKGEKEKNPEEVYCEGYGETYE